MKVRKSPRRFKSGYDLEFYDAKQIVRERSQGACEGFSVALRFAPRDRVHELYPEVSCELRAVHVHHRKYRSRGGTNSLDNLAHLCGFCHRWVHAYPIESGQLGLSLHSGESEELT